MSEIYNIAAVHHEGNPELKVGIRGKEFLLSLNYDNGTILITDPRTRKKLTLEIEDIITDKIYIKLLDGTSNDESSELAVLTADNFVYKSGISLEEFNTAINSIGEKANRTNTLAGYGIDNAYTKDEIDGFIGSTFTFKGVYETYQELLDDVADGTILPKVGWVYNITTGGGTDSRGIDIVDGSYIACNASAEDYETDLHICTWVVVSGLVNLGNFTTSEEVTELLNYKLGEYYKKTEINNTIGDLSDLETFDKSTLIAAINELNSRLSTLENLI